MSAPHSGVAAESVFKAENVLSDVEPESQSLFRNSKVIWYVMAIAWGFQAVCDIRSAVESEKQHVESENGPCVLGNQAQSLLYHFRR